MRASSCVSSDILPVCASLTYSDRELPEVANIKDHKSRARPRRQ